MNWKEFEGRWHQITGQVKSKWGKLTDDDLKVVAGKRDQLIGKIEERYGILKDEAEKQVDEWITKFTATPKHSKETPAQPDKAPQVGSKPAPTPN